jgi:O-antigen ligase
MVLVVMTEVDPLAALRHLILRSGYLLLPLSVLFIKYYPYIGQVYGYLGDVMYTGVTQHKNTLGMVCMILGLGFLWCFFESYSAPNDRFRKRRLIGYAICLAMVAWLLWIAKSATSTSCFVMAGALLAVVSMSATGRKITVVHTLVVLLVSTSLFALFFDPSGNLVQTVGRNSTLTGRVAIWRYALGLSGNPLFGAGFESFWLGSRLQQMWAYLAGDRINQAHNGYLEVYLNLGWCGLILLGTVMATGYRNIISTLRQNRYSAAFKLAYFTAAIMYNFTESAFRMGSMTWILLLMVVVRVPAVRERRSRECEPVVNDSDLVLTALAQTQELA